MARIIRQNSTAASLPDFRNLGTVLRILLAVNAFAAAAAMARDVPAGTWIAAWVDLIATVEPQLLLELAVLYGLGPRLAQHPYSTGALVVAAIGVIAEARLQALQARIRPHFLFTSLNAVLSLVRTEPQRAETALHDMAELFRV